jgi:HlyD family secretion protein
VAIAEADVARADAAVQQAAARLAETVILAPFDAVVMEKLREVGDFVVPGGLDRRGSGSALFRIASTTDPRIEVDISETSIAQLTRGQQASIVLDAVPGRTYRGVLTKISPSANRQKATVKVELDVLDADAAMKPEMTAKVTFEGARDGHDTPSPKLRIPPSAVVDAGSGPAVFVVRAGVARLEPVDGVREGDMIVTSDPHALSDGQQVQVNK